MDTPKSSLWKAFHKEQSQIDWGQAPVTFRHGGERVVHFFVLTLGYSRRSFYAASWIQALGHRAVALPKAPLLSQAEASSLTLESVATEGGLGMRLHRATKSARRAARCDRPSTHPS